ncbi:MAG: hypothetical protein AAGE65_14720, partial [Planctomycetota bacterium]
MLDNPPNDQETFRIYNAPVGGSEVRLPELLVGGGVHEFWIQFDAPTEPLQFRLQADGIGEDLAKAYGACSACGTVCTTGNVNATNGSVNVRIGVGQVDYGEAGGFLKLYAKYPSAELSTPEALSVSLHPDVVKQEAGGVLSAVVLPNGERIDVNVVDAYGYELLVRNADGSLRRTIAISNPDGAAETTRLHVVQTGDQDRAWLYAWSDADQGWVLAEGSDAASIDRRVRRVEVEEDALVRAVTETIEESDGTVVSATREKHRLYPWGEELIELVRDPDGAALTERWEYYDGGAADGDHAGRKKLYVAEGGYWELYEYHPEGFLWRTIKQLDQNAYDDTTPVATLAAQNVVETHDFGTATINNGAGSEDVFYTRRVVTSAGVVVSCGYELDRGDSAWPNREESWGVRCVSAGPATADAATFIESMIQGTNTDGHRVTKTWTWADGQADAYETDRVENADGTVVLYGRPAAGVTVVRRGYPDAAGTSILQGSRTTTTVDASGYAVSTLSERKVDGVHGGGWFTESYALTTTTDNFGRPTETSHYFGDEAVAKAANGPATAAYTIGQTYGCCGIDTQADAEGRVTQYVSDALGRTIAEVHNQQEGDEASGGIVGGLTVRHRVVDAAGRTTRTDQEGSDGITRLIEETEYDLAGRMVWRRNGENEFTFYTYRRIKPDGSPFDPLTDTGIYFWEHRVYPDHGSGGSGETAWTTPPVEVAWIDGAGRTVRTWAGQSGDTWNASSDGSQRPSGNDALTEVSRSTMDGFDWAGRPAETRHYFTLPGSLADAGTEGVHYHVELRGVYDFEGRRIRSIDLSGTITAVVFDADGRPIETWLGTNDTGATPQAPGPGAGNNNMVRVNRSAFDTFGELSTSESAAASDDPSAVRITAYPRSFEVSGTGGLISVSMWSRPQDGLSPWAVQVSDARGRPILNETYMNGQTSGDVGRLDRSERFYDDGPSGFGRLSHERRYLVEGGPPSGYLYLETNYGYDATGRQAYVSLPSGGHSVHRYDRFGRGVGTTVSVGGASTPLDLSDDVVVTEEVRSLDEADRIVEMVALSREAEASDTELGPLWSGGAPVAYARPRFVAYWYDAAGRLTHSGDYGDAAPALYDSAVPPVPGASGSVLVAKQVYGANGRLADAIDNAGVQTRTAYDALGRAERVIENYVDGVPGGAGEDEDRTTRYAYNAAGQVTEQSAELPGGQTQATFYFYGEELAGLGVGSPVARGGLLRAVVYPDAGYATRAAALTAVDGGMVPNPDFVETTYYADGSVKSRTDQRGVELVYLYDNAGRRELQFVQGSFVPGDGSVSYTYTDRGQLDTVKTFANADPDAEHETSRVAHTYDGLGRLLTQEQTHLQGGSVPNPVTGSGMVTYTYDNTASSGLLVHGGRLEKITYPNGREVAYNYGVSGGIDDKLSRPAGIDELTPGSLVRWDTGQGEDRAPLVAYQRDGGGRLAVKSLPNAGVHLNRRDAGGDGYDAFGRVTRHYWERDHDLNGNPLGAPEAVFDIRHAYDAASNRRYADRRVYPGASQSYAYDGLHRLERYDTGILAPATHAVTAWAKNKQAWDLDAVGNPLETDALAQDAFVKQTPNDANELTALQIKGNDPVRPRIEDPFSSDTSANWSAVGTDTFGISGGHLSINSVAADTLEGNTEDEARAVVLWGAANGPVQAQYSFQFPAGATAGRAGFVFGYRSANDYWLQVWDLGAQEVYYQHAVDGVAGPKLAARAWTVQAGTNIHANFNPRLDRRALSGYPFFDYDLPAGQSMPVGQIGVFATAAGTKFDKVNFYHRDWPARMMGRWDLPVDGSVHAAADALQFSGAPQAGPATLNGVRLDNFRATFKLNRHSSNKSGVFVIFDIDDHDAESSLLIHHTAASSYNTVAGVSRGQAAASTVSNVLPACGVDDTLWVRVEAFATGTQAGKVVVYANNTPAQPAAGAWNKVYESDDFDLRGGRFGFARHFWGYAYIDDLTLEADRDADNAFEITEHVEHFTLDGNGYADQAPEYDAAGNLTYDGVFRYAYDAWNRLVSVTKAYKVDTGAGPGALQTGSTLATYRYDGLGRRVVRKLRNVADREATYHDYYNSNWQLLETRDGSGSPVKQHVWGLDYIDELIAVNINHDPWDPTEDLCERVYFALHDAHFNVIGLTNGVGLLVERYEYTPYGQRQVYARDELVGDLNGNGQVEQGDFNLATPFGSVADDEHFAEISGNGIFDQAELNAVNGSWGDRVSDDDRVLTPSLGSAAVHAYGGDLALTRNAVGHQGLTHDGEALGLSGSGGLGLVENRNRTLHPR